MKFKNLNKEYRYKIIDIIDNFDNNYQSIKFKKVILIKIKNKLLNLRINNNFDYKINIIIDIINKKLEIYRKVFRRIAHAWWIYKWNIYTNSINALEKNKDYYNLFELDFNWTKDNKLVCIHDWTWSFYKTFGFKLNGSIPTYNKFIYYVKHNNKYTNCTIETLITWLKNNPKKIIITDMKSKNTSWLNYIAKNYPTYINRFIPQIYNPNNYQSVRNMWYDKIIWTLYMYNWNSNEILQYVNNMSLYAVTMPLERVYNWLWSKINIYTYSHTINSYYKFNQIKKLWINEIYTDKLNY